MKSRQRDREAFREHSYWQSYSDMMAALLLIFILMIAITLAIYRQKTNDLEKTRSFVFCLYMARVMAIISE